MKKNIVFLISILTILSACSNKQVFTVQGKISGEPSKTLYIEEIAVKHTVLLDSVRLSDNGLFCFQIKRPDYPEFYRLRLGTQQLILAIDSTEHINILTTADSLPYAQVEGSNATNTITLLRHKLLHEPIEEYKSAVRKLCLTEPRSLAAYYALFQTKNGNFIFNPYDKNDRVLFSAVATAWQVYYNGSERQKQICELVLNAINNERQEQNNAIIQQFIRQQENTFLDINLPNEYGDTISLSSFRGKVTIIEFSALTQMEQSKAYLFELKELWNKFAPNGMEIYSVSADPSRLLWEDTARNLAWTTVRSDKGINDPVFLNFNISSLPTLFLLDKKGEIIGRYTDFDTLQKDIENNL